MSISHSGAIIQSTNAKIARVGYFLSTEAKSLLNTSFTDTSSLDIGTDGQGIIWKEPQVQGCIQVPYTMSGWTKVCLNDAFKTTLKGKFKVNFNASVMLSAGAGESLLTIQLCKRSDGSAVCTSKSHIALVEGVANTYSSVGMFRIVQLEANVEYHIRISSGVTGDGVLTSDSTLLVEHFQ